MPLIALRLESTLQGWPAANLAPRCPKAASAPLCSIRSLPCCWSILQGSSRLEAGAMAFRNNYAMQQAYSGMPER